MSDYVVIIDKSAGNESVGEMWQETKVFPASATLDEVMRWACPDSFDAPTGFEYSRRRVTITKPHAALETDDKGVE